MLIVLVQVQVKADAVAEFETATLENARRSRQEPGIARFDVLRQADDPTRFVLVEVYRSNDAPVAHKETEHYRTWRERVEPMMVEPRRSVRYTNASPDDAGW